MVREVPAFLAPATLVPLTCVAQALLMTWLAKNTLPWASSSTGRSSFSLRHLNRKMRPYTGLGDTGNMNVQCQPVGCCLVSACWVLSLLHDRAVLQKAAAVAAAGMNILRLGCVAPSQKHGLLQGLVSAATCHTTAPRPPKYCYVLSRHVPATPAVLLISDATTG
jgi:hypothetical protein